MGDVRLTRRRFLSAGLLGVGGAGFVRAAKGCMECLTEKLDGKFPIGKTRVVGDSIIPASVERIPGAQLRQAPQTGEMTPMKYLTARSDDPRLLARRFYLLEFLDGLLPGHRRRRNFPGRLEHRQTDDVEPSRQSFSPEQCGRFSRRHAAHVRHGTARHCITNSQSYEKFDPKHEWPDACGRARRRHDRFCRDGL